MDKEITKDQSDLMLRFEESALADRAALLDMIAPVTEDSIDAEVQAAHYSANKVKNHLLAGLFVLLGVSVVGNVAQSMRPPQFRLVAVDSMGRSAGATNPDGLVPTPPLAKAYLTNFALDRYERLKSTITTKFPLQYLYMAGPAGDEMKAKDTHDAVMAGVLSGRVPENKVKVYPPQILSYSKQKFGDKALWTGLAAIQIEKSFLPHPPEAAHTESWTIGVKFVMNPAQVPEKIAENAVYEQVNPVGLTILEPPAENHNPRGEEDK